MNVLNGRVYSRRESIVPTMLWRQTTGFPFWMRSTDGPPYPALRTSFPMRRLPTTASSPEFERGCSGIIPRRAKGRPLTSGRKIFPERMASPVVCGLLQASGFDDVLPFLKARGERFRSRSRDQPTAIREGACTIGSPIGIRPKGTRTAVDRELGSGGGGQEDPDSDPTQVVGALRIASTGHLDLASGWPMSGSAGCGTILWSGRDPEASLERLEGSSTDENLSQLLKQYGDSSRVRNALASEPKTCEWPAGVSGRRRRYR